MRTKSIKSIIAEMLKENTGVHMLDSGGAYGRNWQRNQHKDFDQAPEATMEVYTDAEDKPNEVEVTFNVYHYLINHLEVNETTEHLQRHFECFAEGLNEAHLASMERFADELKRYDNRGTTNTYNYDNILSQTLQYTMFEDVDKKRVFILLQIHGGCDVRGGYTAPHVFEILDFDYFILAQSDASLRCTGLRYVTEGGLFKGRGPIERKKEPCQNNWWSDDGGYSWYYNGCSSDQKPLFENTHVEEGAEDVLRCNECNGIIKPVVMTSF